MTAVVSPSPSVPHLVDDLEDSLDAAPVAKWSRSDVPRELLVRATVPGLFRMALSEWAMILGLWGAMIYGPKLLWPLWMLLVAGRFHALGILMHDACHLPLRKHSALVRVFEAIAGFPIATTLAAMRYHHIRHHRDSGMPTDPYFKGGLQGRPGLYALNILRGLLLIPFWTVRPVVGLISLLVPCWRTPYARIFLQDKSGQDLTHSREVISCAKAELSQLVVQASILTALALWPTEVLYGYVLPIEGLGLLAAWRLLQEHNYTPAHDRRVETILATTNDHGLGRLSWLVVAPRNIGHHVVHHLHPQVGLAALPAVRQWYLDNTDYARMAGRP